MDFETDEARMSAAEIHRAITDGVIDGVVNGIPVRVGDNGETLALNGDGHWEPLNSSDN